jgi:8-oxo-dGTP diphosphatase
MTTKKGGKYVYDFPKPSVTVDIVLVDKAFKVLLIKRKSDPFAECWALPGGFVDENEKLADAARRELVEETGVEFDTLEQLYTAGDQRGLFCTNFKTAKNQSGR